MRITVSTLATAISLAVFACSESPNSPSSDSSSNEVASSSSNGNGGGSSSSFNVLEGRACEYSGEELGISGLFACAEVPSNVLNLQEHITECEEDGGIWVNACPGGEKITCIDDEDTEDILYKIYANGFTCSALSLKNADGSKDTVSKGGACGPFSPIKNIPFSMCTEFPELSTALIKLSCTGIQAPFANECPGNADLICYDPEDEAISHFYGQAIYSRTCEDFDMEKFIPFR